MHRWLKRKTRPPAANNGHITTRHKGGGHKQHYRVVDFKRSKNGIPAKVERIEYDPNRTAFIALSRYADGERRYIIAPRGIRSRCCIWCLGVELQLKQAMPCRSAIFRVGTTIHCIDMKPGKGAQIARSAGASAVLLAKEGIYAQVRLRSGEARKIHVDCRATIGEVGNEEAEPEKKSVKPVPIVGAVFATVRGVVMNPVDHPHGGGEGRTGEAREPVSPWVHLRKVTVP